MGRTERGCYEQKLNPLARLRAKHRSAGFWQSRDAMDCVWRQAKRVGHANLKMSTTAIRCVCRTDFSIASKSPPTSGDVPYQSLIKVWPAEKVDVE
jgi:hypothetical protein